MLFLFLCIQFITTSFLLDKDKVYVRIQLSNYSFRHIELKNGNTLNLTDSLQIELHLNELKDSLIIEYNHNNQSIDSKYYLIGDSLSIDSIQVYDPIKDEFLIEVYPTFQLFPIN